MAETKKIILASVLKPVDEPRMLNKLGFSLRETNKYGVYILGFPPKNPSIFPEITFYSIFDEKRTHPSRLLAGFRLLRSIFTLRPALVVITTYELIPALILAKWVHRFKAVYDVQENYAENILHNKTLPFLLRKPVAASIRCIEYVGGHWIDWYFLAERCYEKSLRKPQISTLLENKYQGAVRKTGPVRLNRSKGFHFVITGTLSEVFGVAEAVNWFRELVKTEPQHTLEIIGHCPVKGFRKRLQQLAGDCSQIRLVASPTPVPYTDLAHASSKADLWLMPYRPIESIREKMPTKLFEAMARCIPVLISPNPLWEDLIHSYPGGIAVDFSVTKDIGAVLEQIENTSFFTRQPGMEVTWESEKRKLLDTLEKLI